MLCPVNAEEHWVVDLTKTQGVDILFFQWEILGTDNILSSGSMDHCLRSLHGIKTKVGKGKFAIQVLVRKGALTEPISKPL
jgi:hypothetical protein